MRTHLIASLGLQPHPEGGHYKETYRAPLVIDVDGRTRAVSTAIYFLLGRNEFSTLHRIRSDEVWHFYSGRDLEVVSFDDDGTVRRERVGSDPKTGAVPQLVVPAGRWFGARLAANAADDEDDNDADDDEAYALVGCTVAPGFDFADFELGDRAALLARYPGHADIVGALTRG
jgi:hypothetical protein